MIVIIDDQQIVGEHFVGLRDRYYVYSVSETDSVTPAITRWADPLALIKEGKGRLLLAKAQMSLTLDNVPDADSSAGS